MSVIIGDIGGTNIRLQLISSHNMVLASYHTNTKSCNSCIHAIQGLLAQQALTAAPRPSALRLAFAGCVSDDRRSARGSNLAHWGEISASELEAVFCLKRAEFFNDLEASVLGLRVLPVNEIIEIRGNLKAESLARQSRLVVGIGTGVGVAFAPTPATVCPTEAGWRTFAPRSDFDLDLIKFVRNRKFLDRVVVEHIVGGNAITDIYGFLSSRNVGPNKSTTTDDLKPSKIYALAEDGDSVAVEAIRRQWEYLGREIAEQVLSYIPRGGVFLTGGVVSKVRKFIDTPFLRGFTESLGNKILDDLVSKIPVFLVEQEDLPLLGLMSMNDSTASSYFSTKATDIERYPT